MFFLGIILVFVGIGAIMGFYQDKQRFMRGDYTEKDIKIYQKNLLISFLIIVFGIILIF